MKRLINLITSLAIILTLVSIGCKKQENDDQQTNVANDTNEPGSDVTTFLCGTVLDREGTLLNGAVVKFGNQTTATNEHGYFSFGNVTTDERCYVNVKREFYFETGLASRAVDGGITNMRIVMTDNLPDLFINGAAGGAVNLVNGASVILPAGGIAYEDGTICTGNVNVAIDYFNPDDPNFPMIIPGGDLAGIAANGDEVQLWSFGMLAVELTDASGVALNIAPSYTATVNFPVPASMIANAPASIPSWHFNEITGLWDETGILTLNGGVYTGTVNHFTMLNADAQNPYSIVSGYVVDCNGDPLSNVRVRIGQVNAFTDQEGFFTNIIPSNIATEVYVDMPEMGLSSATVSVPSLSLLEEFEIGTLQTQCPGYFSITTTCDVGVLSGYVAVNWPGGNINTPISSDTTWVYMVPANGAVAEVIAVGLNTSITETGSFTFPTIPGDTVDAGTFELCGDGPTGDYGASLILNGDGYNDYSFDISTTPQYAFGSLNENQYMSVYADNLLGDYIVLSYPGASPGSWDMGVDGNVSFSFNLNGDLWSAQSGSVTVSQSGNVGQPISGTFSGVVTRIEGVNVISADVTNGSFYVLRSPDVQ